MYRSGDLHVRVTPLGDDERDDQFPNYDARTDNYDPPKPPVAWLDHSCDEWVIGGPEQVEAMIADLQAVLAEMRKASQP